MRAMQNQGSPILDNFLRLYIFPMGLQSNTLKSKNHQSTWACIHGWVIELKLAGYKTLKSFLENKYFQSKEVMVVYSDPIGPK